ncbi:hypothetical protein [Singulisphaera sp. PoT]|uniref:carboxypeptidase-like regulatory domain-containing protein n=1 Tax=Singulisphaera sp. PoT TaxID=3411797 RepID=UPI003BF50EBE
MAWKRDNPGCPCCGKPSCKSCVIVTDGCSGARVAGASVTLSDGTNTYGPVLTTGQIIAVNVSPHGTGYDPTNVPTVTISGGGGSGATATAILSGGVPSASMTSPGTGYTNPRLAIGGATTGSRATVSYACQVDNLTLNSGGGGFTDGTGYALSFSGGTPTTAAVGTFDVVGGAVQNLVITNRGAGYKFAPSVGFSAAGSGTGAWATATLRFTSISAGGGTLYVSPAVTITDPSGTGAAANATASAITIGSVIVNSGGSGYTSAPAVSFASSSGSGAVATATVATLACFPKVPTGTYTRTTTATGYGTDTSTVTITKGVNCGPSNAATVNLPPIGYFTVNWFVIGCGSQVHFPDTGNPLPGATVTMTGAGGLSATGTTDASGLLTLALGPFTGTLPSWSATVSYPGFFNRTITGAPNICAGTTRNQQIKMTAASPIPATMGWICIPGPSGQCGPYSFELTDLTITDSKNGTTTLTYLGLNSGGFYNWEGSQAGTFDAAGSCPASSGTVSYSLTLNPTGGWSFGVGLSMQDVYGFGCDCPGPGSPPCTSRIGCGPISSSYTCPPAFMLVFSLDPSSAVLCLGAYGSGGGTFTITQ